MEWSAGAVAKMLGISPTTLRTWDRRYGLGPTARDEGKHRRYSSDDVERLKRMVELTGSGVSPASAAASLVPEVSPVAGDFVMAASLLDAVEMRRVAVDLIACHGVVHTWDVVLMPFLVELGQRVSAEAAGIEVEHIASLSIVDAMRSSPAPGAPSVLLACAPDEQHSLPLDVLAAALAEHGCAVRNLGARVPADALVSAAERLKPQVVFVWAHDRTYAEQVPLAVLAEGSTSVGHALPVALSVLVGGPGWGDVPLPPGVRWVDTLTVAVETILDRI